MKRRKEANATAKTNAAPQPIQRCTVCGNACPQPEDLNGRPLFGSRYGHHVYGSFSEPRCSYECALKPVVDVASQRRLVRMGDIVLEARGASGFGRFLAAAMADPTTAEQIRAGNDSLP
jgi:hypothetical protein